MFKAGDLVVCIDDGNRSKSVREGELYTVVEVSYDYPHLIEVSGPNITENNSFYYYRFRKAIKKKDNGLIRKLAKVLKEEDGYIWI